MPKKEAKIKSLFNENNYTLYLEMIKTAKVPFTIKQSNYTLDIESDFLNIQFMQNIMSEKAFIANQMIKGDIKRFNIVPPEIDREMIKYYAFNIPKKLQAAKNTVYNIDIKSAYATVLLNHHVITDKTFNYLCHVQKKDRLAAIGMLAGRKNIFHYDKNAEVIEFEITENPLSNFFYFCIYHVERIMDAIRAAIGNSFLFYWIDGIYFDNPDKAPLIMQILRENQYKYSFDTLTDFIYKEHEKRFIIYYKKDGEQKTFNVPKHNSTVAKEIINFLSLHK